MTSNTNNIFVVYGVAYVDFSVEIAASSREEAEAIFQQSAAILVQRDASLYYSNIDIHHIDGIDENIVD